jgi:predicted amidohydrolase YtcJ
MYFQGDIIIDEQGFIKELIKRDSLKIIKLNSKAEPIIYEMGSAFAYPAFVDHHIHLSGYGMRLMSLSLFDCASPEACIEKALQENYIIRGEWIEGIGWNQEHWKNKAYPNRYLLDAYFPNNPVILLRADAHCAWCNTKALEISGLINSSNLFSNLIEKDKSGYPTGIVFDSALEHVKSFIPPYSLENQISFVLAAQESLINYGILSIREMETDADLLNSLLGLDQDNKVKIDISAYLKNIADYKNLKTNKIQIDGIKIFADGALGSRGASLFEPYADAPNHCGVLLSDSDNTLRQIQKAHKIGLGAAIHCIGDKACYHSAKAIQKAKGQGIDSLLVMEHCQILNEETINIMSEYSIPASIQPSHFLSDYPDMATSRLGKNRLKNAYKWKTLLDNGISLYFGSDAPIESPDPLLNFKATVLGKRQENICDRSNESLSFENVFDAYFYNSEILFTKPIGKLLVNKKADIIVFNREIDNIFNNLSIIPKNIIKNGIFLK